MLAGLASLLRDLGFLACLFLNEPLLLLRRGWLPMVNLELPRLKVDQSRLCLCAEFCPLPLKLHILTSSSVVTATRVSRCGIELAQPVEQAHALPFRWRPVLLRINGVDGLPLPGRFLFALATCTFLIFISLHLLSRVPLKRVYRMLRTRIRLCLALFCTGLPSLALARDTVEAS